MAGNPQLLPSDKPRLASQLDRLGAFFRAHPGVWLTLREAAGRIGASEAGASARLRDLRKQGWTVTKRKRRAHLYEYLGVPPGQPSQLEIVL